MSTKRVTHLPIKAFYTALIICAASASLSAAVVSKAQFFSHSSSGTATISNSYVEAAMASDGTFTIGTKAGDPKRASDDNKKLLFGHPSPSTSDTILRIDGTDYDLDDGTHTVDVVAASDQITTTFRNAGIDVTESLKIVKSKGTRNKDTIQIAFRLTNVDTVSHNVSLRTQLDTQLGSNDGAPFRVPGVGAITADKEFDNDAATTAIGDIPVQAIVFDKLSDPEIVALFTFRGLGFRTPDRIVFGSWGLARGSYDYTVTGTTFLDSSLVVYWGQPHATNPIVLAPGESVDLAFLYGLGEFKFVKGSPFNVGIFRPAEIEPTTTTVATYQYQPYPFTVVAFFENSAGVAVSNAEATMKVPPEFVFYTGETALKSIEDTAGGKTVAAGNTASASWNIATVGSSRVDLQACKLEYSIVSPK